MQQAAAVGTCVIIIMSGAEHPDPNHLFPDLTLRFLSGLIERDYCFPTFQLWAHLENLCRISELERGDNNNNNRNHPKEATAASNVSVHPCKAVQVVSLPWQRLLPFGSCAYGCWQARFKHHHNHHHNMHLCFGTLLLS